MGPIEVWQVFWVQIIFLAYLGLNLLLYWRLKRPVFFVLSAAGFSALAYLILIYKYHVTWWGLQGDEIFVAAYLQKMASGHFFSDFFYNQLPPFYPPLYFWVFGLVAYLFDFSGVTSAHLGVVCVIFFVPLTAYACQRWYFKNDPAGLRPWQSAMIACLLLVVLDKTAIFLKPYEYVSATLSVFWAWFLFNDLALNRLNLKRRIVYIITGGFLFLTFYFWFLLIALAAGLFKLFCRTRSSKYYAELFIIGAGVGLMSLVFTAPLALSYWRYGSENWQSGFLIFSDFDYYLPFLSLSVFGAVALIGLATLIIFRKDPLTKALISLLLACYVWQLTNALTMIFFQATFLPAKPFLFFGGAVLSVAAGLGLGRFWQKLKIPKTWDLAVFAGGLMIYASQMIFGAFIFDPGVQNQLVRIKSYPKPEIAYLENQIKKVPGLDKLVILSGGIPELSGYLPLDYYLSYNIHFSHPAAGFSERYYFVKSLARAASAKSFYELIKSAPRQKIDAILVFKGEGDYPFVFWLDNFPDGAREEVTWVRSELIGPQYFEVLYEDKFFILFKVK